MLDLSYFDKAFLEPWRVVIVSLEAGGDSATAGAILAIILVILWAFMFWMLKLIILDVIFPKIRLIDQYGNRINTTRVYLHTRAAKPSITDCLTEHKREYWYGKFRLFPILQFYRIMVDKGAYRTRRTPWHIDIFTNGMNFQWDEKESCYVVNDKDIADTYDEKAPYLSDALDDVQTVGDMVVEGVKGDFGLIKRKFKLGLSVKRLTDHNINDEELKEDYANE